MVLGGYTGIAMGKPLRVVVLTDAAGLGDKGFNDVCWQGVLKAREDFGVDAQFLQAREQADYVPTLTVVALNADVVITLGFLYVDALKQVAPRFPKTYFIHIEGDVPLENVASFDFKSEEGGFLGGLVAGLFTRNRKVGVVSGMEIPPVEAYVSGFAAGVKTAEKARGESIETIVVSAGSFNDPVKGKSLAQAIMGQGADVIFRVAGNTGVGVTQAVRTTAGVYLIAEDLDQDAEVPGKVLTSALKRMDLAIYQAIQDVVHSCFRGGHRVLGAQDGAIDITPMKYSSSLFSPTDLDRIKRARELLKSGSLTIPLRRSEVSAFQVPDL
jgi:basic membrane protein A